MQRTPVETTDGQELELVADLGCWSLAFDPSDDAEGLPWAVLDEDGEVWHWYATRAEGFREAKHLQSEADAEAASGRRSELKDEIASLLDDCENEAYLNAILALLKSANTPD